MRNSSRIGQRSLAKQDKRSCLSDIRSPVTVWRWSMSETLALTRQQRGDASENYQQPQGFKPAEVIY